MSRGPVVGDELSGGKLMTNNLILYFEVRDLKKDSLPLIGEEKKALAPDGFELGTFGLRDHCSNHFAITTPPIFLNRSVLFWRRAAPHGTAPLGAVRLGGPNVGRGLSLAPGDVGG